MKYRPEIDGLRAIAVLPVILFHAGFSAFSGGFVGVDVFFVISGYLITSIITTEMDEGRFSLLDFYERRIRRILPALFFVMLVCLPLAWFLLIPIYMKDFAQSLVSVAAFASNILFWKESGYFGGQADVKPLLHTWSLAVEEQYYMLFPLFLLAIWPRSKKIAIGVLGIIFILSLGLAQWYLPYKKDAVFFLLHFRAWELLAGAFAAIYLQKNTIRLNALCMNGLSIAGFALIILPIFMYHDKTPFPGITALPPVLGTVMVILFTASSTLLHRLLSLRALVAIGLISYSLYLWHQPIFSFAHFYYVEELPAVIYLLLIGLSFIGAIFSWKYIEAPFRNKTRMNRLAVALWIIPIWTIFVVFGFFGHKTNGYIDRKPPSNMSADAFYIIGDYGISPYGINGNICEAEKSAVCLRYQPKNTDDKSKRILLLGDSHSGDFKTFFTKFAKSRNSQAWQMSVGGCGYIPAHFEKNNGECEKAVSDAIRIIKDNHIDTIILVTNTGSDYRKFTAEEAQIQSQAFLGFIDQLLAQDVKIIYFTSRRMTNYNPNLARFSQKECKLANRNVTKSYLQLEETLSKHITDTGGMMFDQREYLDILQGEDKCSLGFWNKKPLYSDTSHLTEFGAQTVFEEFERELNQSQMHDHFN